MHVCVVCGQPAHLADLAHRTASYHEQNDVRWDCGPPPHGPCDSLAVACERLVPCHPHHYAADKAHKKGKKSAEQEAQPAEPAAAAAAADGADAARRNKKRRRPKKGSGDEPALNADEAERCKRQRHLRELALKLRAQGREYKPKRKHKPRRRVQVGRAGCAESYVTLQQRTSLRNGCRSRAS